MEDQKRECGDCSLCCKLMELPEIQKPADQWCFMVKDKSKGCSCYATRPTACRDLRCFWLDGVIDERLKPNKVKVVALLVKTVIGPTVLLLEDLPNVAVRRFYRYIEVWTRTQLSVCVLHRGQKKIILAKGETLEGLKERYKEGYAAQGKEFQPGPVLAGSGEESKNEGADSHES